MRVHACVCVRCSVCARARACVSSSFFGGWFCVKAAQVPTRPRSESTPRAATKVSKVREVRKVSIASPARKLPRRFLEDQTFVLLFSCDQVSSMIKLTARTCNKSFRGLVHTSSVGPHTLVSAAINSYHLASQNPRINYSIQGK